jgi:hypothetical protein
MILDIQFQVSVSVRFSEAVSRIESAPLDLIVIHGDPENWKRIAELASKKNRSVKIVAVTFTEDEHPAWVDAVIYSVCGPYALLKVCEGLFGMTSKKRTHGFSLGGTGTYIPKRSKAALDQKRGD